MCPSFCSGFGWNALILIKKYGHKTITQIVNIQPKKIDENLTRKSLELLKFYTKKLF